MKSKATTYILVVAVIAVWGFIAWKIFAQKKEPITALAPRVEGTELHNAEEEEKLLLDYTDPFLKDAGTPRGVKHSVAPAQRQAAAPPKKPTPPKPTPTLKYTGTIRAGGRVSFLFDHNGIQHALVPGDELDGYTLSQTWQDSVIVTKDSDNFTLYIQK